VSVGHAGLAQLFFCTIVSICTFLSFGWRTARPDAELGSASSLRRLCIATTVLIYLQILMGAVVRHTESGLAIPDFPLSYGKLVPALDAASVDAINFERRWGAVWLPEVTAQQVLFHYLHRVGAVIVALAVMYTAIRVLLAARGSRGD